MERFSRACTGLMLALFLLLMDASLLLETLGNPGHRSYNAALLLALLAAALFMRLTRRNSSLFARWGARTTGIVLGCACFGLHLLWGLCVSVPIFGDASAYWETATALAAGAPLENASYLALFPHLLGYASFLSLFLRVFGAYKLVAVLLNVCLCTASGLLLYRLCLRYGTLRQAGWALLLWTLCPSKLMYSGMVLSDGMYTCLMLAIVALLARLEQRGMNPGRLILSALLAGALLWTMNAARPLGAVMLIALLLWMLFLRGTGKGLGRWLAVLALLFAVYVPLGQIWNAHIEQLVGEAPAPIPGYNIYVGFNQETGGTYSEDDMGLLGDYRWEEGGSAVSAQWKMLQAAKERIASGNLDFPRLFADKMRNFSGSDQGAAFSMGPAFNTRQYQVAAVLSNVFYYAVVLLANLGAWRLWRRGEHGVALCLPLFGLGLFLAQMLVEVSLRYHYALLPILIALAVMSVPEAQRR